MIWQLNEKSNAQDSLVTLYVAKEKNYIDQITNYDQILTKQKAIITGLESDVATLTSKNERLKKGLKWLGGGFVASLLSVVTLVTIK
jgi:phage shock protein A